MSLATATPEAGTAVVPGGLLLRVGPALRLSEDDFWSLCQANPGLNLERTAAGDIVIMPPAGADGDNRNTDLVGQLWAWNRAADPGEVFGQSAGFTLPSGEIVGPDAAWIARDRWEALPIDDRKRFAHICPDFVVEVISPGQTPAGLRPRVRQYLDEGAAGLADRPETQARRGLPPGPAGRVAQCPGHAPRRGHPARLRPRPDPDLRALSRGPAWIPRPRFG